MISKRLMLTPLRVVGFTAASIMIYVLWRGPERFYYESLGTWAISPSIYVRVLPSPFNQWLLAGIQKIPLLSAALCGAPLVMLLVSSASALYSIWRVSGEHTPLFPWLWLLRCFPFITASSRSASGFSVTDGLDSFSVPVAWPKERGQSFHDGKHFDQILVTLISAPTLLVFLRLADNGLVVLRVQTEEPGSRRSMFN